MEDFFCKNRTISSNYWRQAAYFVPFVVANGLKDLGGLLKTLLSITKYEKYFIYSEYFM